MKIDLIQPKGLLLPNAFYQILQTEITKTNLNLKTINALTVNFKDPEYSSDSGGYHPVEIRIERTNKGLCLIYFTDFSYQGYPQAELIKEIDVCFVTARLTSLFVGFQSVLIDKEFLDMLINNFVDYYSMGIYEVTIDVD